MNMTHRGAKYAVTFREKILGADCDINVAVNISTLESTATISMRGIFGRQPAFVISLSNMKLLEGELKEIKSAAELLKTKLPQAKDHQIDISVDGASVIVVQPPDMVPRYTLSIGLFHREGQLSELNISEITEANRLVDGFVTAVVGKVKSVRIAG